MGQMTTRMARAAAATLLLIAPWGCSHPADKPVEGKPTGQAKSETPAGPFTVTQAIGDHYTPGGPITVKATMNYTGTEPVTALALQTKLPPAWTYGGIGGTLKPAIDPPVGTTDELTQIWIQIPSFPATVEYTLKVADWSEGTCTVTAQAIYRTLGGELKSSADEAELTRAK